MFVSLFKEDTSHVVMLQLLLDYSTRQMDVYSYMYMWLSKPVSRVLCIEPIRYTIALQCVGRF
jgi:hypothetical protein